MDLSPFGLLKIELEKYPDSLPCLQGVFAFHRKKTQIPCLHFILGEKSRVTFCLFLIKPNRVHAGVDPRFLLLE